MPQHIHSPIGLIRIETDGSVLTAIRLGVSAPGASPDDGDALAAEAAIQLAAWFEGRLTRFDLPLAPTRTARGEVLRAAIGGIGYGETQGYGEIARRIGSSARAIGQACARNAFPILVPCHRVLGAGGTIGHYSAGNGIETKRRLLDLERHQT